MFKLEFETGNGAFQENGLAGEIENILRRVIARVVVHDDKGGKCVDSNGNTVGKWELTEGEQ